MQDDDPDGQGPDGPGVEQQGRHHGVVALDDAADQSRAQPGIAPLLNCGYAESMAVDDTLRALANPTRRAMLELVWDAERTSSEIAEAVGATRPAASQHLKVLREAGLVRVRADGSQRLYRVDTEQVAEVWAALERFWGARLGRLSAAVVADRDRETGGGRR
jgi:DNA-binding transcriptional ArsR family regulator